MNLDLPGWTGRIRNVLQEGEPGRAMIALVELEGGREAILKRYPRTGWGRSWMYRLMVAREARAYRRLVGIPGVPQLYAGDRTRGLLLECISEAKPVSAISERLPQSFLDRTRSLLERVRERGVLHGDVARNVLAGTGGVPALVDFGASFVIPAWWPNLLRRWLLRLGRTYDERALVELKYRNCPSALTPAEREIRSGRLPWQGVVSPAQTVLQRSARLLIGLKKGIGRDRPLPGKEST